MKIIIYLSEFMIPITAIFIVGYGLIKKQKVYEQFIDGAKDGLGTVLSIIPTLIGLMIENQGFVLSIVNHIVVLFPTSFVTTRVYVPSPVIGVPEVKVCPFNIPLPTATIGVTSLL